MTWLGVDITRAYQKMRQTYRERDELIERHRKENEERDRQEAQSKLGKHNKKVDSYLSR